MRAALDRLAMALAAAAAAFARLRAWSVFGFARLDDHARERFGRSARWLRDLAALGDGLADSPALADALTGADGGRPLGRVAATLVARANAPRARAAEARARAAGPLPDATVPPANAESVDDWIEAARGLGVRDLRAAMRTARGAADATAPDSEAPDPDDDRVHMTLPVPSPMLAAFDETLDLHRAVEGHTSSVAAFIESLVGEARSGGAEIDPGFVRALEHGSPEARYEAALRRASVAWSTLPAPLPATDASFAADLVARFRALEAVAGTGDAVELDRQLRALIELETALETVLGRLLAFMTERRDWARLRFAGVGHYAEERLGMSRSRAGERARLARGLRSLPAVADACGTGRISMEAAAIIHRILSGAPDSGMGGAGDLESAWVEHAATVTIKRMRDEARALGRYRARSYRAGTAAIDPKRAAALDPARTAALDPKRAAALGPAGAESATWPRPLADARWGSSLRREAGTAASRIFEFGLIAAGFLPAPEPDVFQAEPTASAEPDVFHAVLPEPDASLRLRLPAEVAADFLAAIEAARVAVEARVALVPWDQPWSAAAGAASECAAAAGAASERTAGPSAAEWAARIAFIRGRRVPRWVGLLALLEEFAATWDSDAAAPERRDDTVFVRDGWRCMAPGCSSRRNLEIHHIVYRSHDGSDDGWNLVTLCRFHHLAASTVV